jgi:hypothetical protein
MSGPRLALLVGAPRSGTTWLQTLLGSRTEVATPQETDLFSRYVGPLVEAWDWQRRGSPDDWFVRRYKGLPGIIDGREFDELVDTVIQRVLEAVVKLAPGSSTVVEKSPSHSLCADLVARFAPEARVIHLVRDGRDVAMSMNAAAGGWGRGWAPPDVEAAARSWVRHVQGAREYRLIGFRYREVRYESLLGADVDTLRELFDFLEVEVGDEECALIYESCALDRMRARTTQDPILVGGEFAPYAAGRSEPDGFFGAGSVGAWRTAWSVGDRLQFRAIAGSELQRLGYEPDGRWAATPVQAVVHSASAAARRGVGGAARRIGRAGERLQRGRA